MLSTIQMEVVYTVGVYVRTLPLCHAALEVWYWSMGVYHIWKRLSGESIPATI